MTHTDERWQEMRGSWEHLGRAAEHLARRVARDARRFAARIEEHVGEFAGDVGREWRCAAGAGRHVPRGSAEEVRRVFDDVRGVLAAVLEGVDELITDVFSGGREEPWTRVVCNRDTACEGCGNTVPTGGEGYVRRRPGGRQFRCAACGIPADGPRTV
jgi:hypothetical protein